MKKFPSVIFAITGACLLCWYLYGWFSSTDLVHHEPEAEIVLDADRPSQLQLLVGSPHGYDAKLLQEARWNNAVEHHTVRLPIPGIGDPKKLRLDFGMARGKWKIHSLVLRGPYYTCEFRSDSLLHSFAPSAHIETFRVDSADGSVTLISSSFDGYLESTFDFSSVYYRLQEQPAVHTVALGLAVVLSIIAGMALYRRMRSGGIKREHRLQWTYIASFIVFISLPLLVMNIRTKNGNAEKRTLANKPLLENASLLRYPGRYTAYFDDHFGLRRPLIFLNSYTKLKLFNISSKPEKVMLGKSSWMYTTDPELIGDFQNNKSFTDAELGMILQNLQELQEWHTRRGIRFYVMVAPTKFSIYPEFLPGRFHINPKPTRLDQLVRYLAAHNGPELILPHSALINAKPSAPVFYAHDIHWNTFGAYIAYTVLMQHMGITAQPQDDFESMFISDNDADLSLQLGLGNILRKDEWFMHSKKPLPFYPAHTPDYPGAYLLEPTLCLEQRDTTLPRLLMYRDSFVNPMIPFLSHHFSRSVYLWTTEPSAVATLQEHPDIVVYELVESHLDKLLDKPPLEFRKK